jgi:hypothetical protein
MSTNQYELGELIKIFEKHSIELQKESKDRRDRYANADIELDPSFDLEFDLPKALATMCKEISNLKYDIKNNLGIKVNKLKTEIEDLENELDEYRNR